MIQTHGLFDRINHDFFHDLNMSSYHDIIATEINLTQNLSTYLRLYENLTLPVI